MTSEHTLRTVIVADDHKLFLYGLTMMLNDEFGTAKIVETVSLYDALSKLAEHPETDLLLVDLYMPGMEGPKTVAGIRAAYPKLKIVMLTASENADDAAEAVAAGANGYIPKSMVESKVIAALRKVLNGETFEPGLVSLAKGSTHLSKTDETMRRKAAIARLTPRQREILDCVSRGLSNRQIAEELGISESTVVNHLAHLFEVLNVRNRTELAMLT